MTKILITGNGFDLFHHLPTKYGHFMSIMKCIEGNNFSKNISFEDLFGSFFKDEYEIDYNLIVENYKVAQFKFEVDKINDLKVSLQNNLWYKYFKNIVEIETWIDFEIEIENILKQLSILLKSETTQSKKVNYYRDVPINYSDFGLFGIIEHKYDDKELFSIPEKYVDKRKLGLKIGYVLRDLSSSFENFIIIFNKYLVDIVGVFYENKTHNHIIPFHLLNEIYTFNYTPTLEKFYNVDKSKVVYLHGEMNEDSKIQNLVFGVSEIPEDVKIIKAYDFAKYYQRIKKNSNKNSLKFHLKKPIELMKQFFL